MNFVINTFYLKTYKEKNITIQIISLRDSLCPRIFKISHLEYIFTIFLLKVTYYS